MSKSASIELIKPLKKIEFIQNLSTLFIKEVNDKELLLSLYSKWVWLFLIEPTNVKECEIQFSNDFSKLERLEFLNNLKKSIDFIITDSDDMNDYDESIL